MAELAAKNWLAQDCALVRFKDDPALLHWRVILACHQGDEVIVVTPDRDVQDTTLVVGDTYSEVKKMSFGRLPAGVRERATYLPKHSGYGEFTADEVLRLARMAERQIKYRFERRRLHGRPEEAAAGERLPVRDDDDGTLIHLVVYRTGGGNLGEELEPPRDATRVVVGGKTFHLFSLGDEEVLTRAVVPSELGALQKSLKVVNPEPAVADSRDVRILPVMFDSAEERWRTIHEAVPEMEEIDYEDFPLAGPRTIVHDMRQLRRMSMDFVQHHESWLRKSGVRHSDRSVHEHAAICRSLNYLVCYDQLNAGGLACAEAMNRRRTLIEHAHQGRPDTPSYEGAEEFLGVKEAPDGSLIDPALQQHAARRQATKAEILKQTRLAAEERKHLRGDQRDQKGGGKGGGANKEKAPEKP